MLIHLLVQQPQVLGRIIHNTPSWVWGLLAGLMGLGISQLRARNVGLARALTTPVAMLGLSVYGVTSAFGGTGATWLTVAVWLAAALGVAGVALWLQPAAPQETRYEGAQHSFYIPGSATPLVLILGIFLTKYWVGVELALQPALAHNGSFALPIAVLYGAFSGVFTARALRLWKLVQRSATLAATTAMA